MLDSDSEIDFESILEECIAQNASVKKTANNKSDLESKFNNLLKTLENTKKELDEKKKKLAAYELIRSENIKKLYILNNKCKIINEQTKSIHEKIDEHHTKLEKASNNFATTIKNSLEQLDNFNLEFAEDRLEKEIEMFKKKLEYAQQKEFDLKDYYEEIKKSQSYNLELYDNLKLSKLIDLDKYKSVEDYEKEISDIVANTNMYKKKTEELISKFV